VVPSERKCSIDRFEVGHPVTTVRKKINMVVTMAANSPERLKMGEEQSEFRLIYSNAAQQPSVQLTQYED
jgi:hypothetical protein